MDQETRRALFEKVTDLVARDELPEKWEALRPLATCGLLMRKRRAMVRAGIACSEVTVRHNGTESRMKVRA